MRLKACFQNEEVELDEVVEALPIKVVFRPKSGGAITQRYASLKQLCEDWEEVEDE